MANWISALPFQIPFNIEELESNPIEPRVPFDEERDKIVGEMTDDEKLVFSLWQKTEEEAKRAALDAEYGRDEENRQGRGEQAGSSVSVFEDDAHEQHLPGHVLVDDLGTPA